MGITSRLCNPTPFPVKFQWEPGRPIIIDPDGFAELTHEQLLDFRPGQPGSEEVRKQTDFLGIFLFDSDRSYDVQALEACRLASKVKNEEYKLRMQNLRNMRTAAGMRPDEDTMTELERQSGLYRLREESAALKARVEIFGEAVANEETRSKEAIDFTRTCLATNPPREFASPTALKVFLSENPDVAERHFALVTAMQENTDG